MADSHDEDMRKTVAALYPLLYPDDAPAPIFECAVRKSTPMLRARTPIAFPSAYPPVQVEKFEQRPNSKLAKADAPTGKATPVRHEGQPNSLNGVMRRLQDIITKQNSAGQAGSLSARGRCIWHVIDLVVCALESLRHWQEKENAQRQMIRRELRLRIEDAEYKISKLGTWSEKVEGRVQGLLGALEKQTGPLAESRTKVEEESVQVGWSPL